jgi:hypothetical protein
MWNLNNMETMVGWWPKKPDTNSKVYRIFRCEVGPNFDNSRLISKTLADMRFLCFFLSTLVLEKEGATVDVITLSAVDKIFTSIKCLRQSEDISEEERRQQNQKQVQTTKLQI